MAKSINLKKEQEADERVLKFYEFGQNNSGGSFDVNENVSHRVIVQAYSAEEAEDKFRPMIEDQSGSCPCCGERWYVSADEVDISTLRYPAGVYTHYKDYEKRWFDLYGEFPRTAEPALENRYGFNEFKAGLYFESIEQYAQFLANRYGSCTPDVIIHYYDGTKKNIYTKVLTPEDNG